MAGEEHTAVQVRAVSRYARVAPNKARQVVAHIRGREIEDARRLLELSPKAVAGQILKTLNSAVANAEHNNGMDSDDLIVALAVVDEGPILKRFQPRAMGRAYRIRKRTSHITITVGAKPSEPATRRAPSGAAVAAGTKQRDAGPAEKPGTSSDSGTGPSDEE